MPIHRKPVTVALPVAEQQTIDIPPTVVSDKMAAPLFTVVALETL
jgi:hypothetical protein